MNRQFQFEWFKLRRRWMPRVILLLLLALTVLAFWGQSTRAHGRGDLFLPRGWLTALLYCSFFAPFFWPVLGGSWAGNEYGWGTIRSVLTRRPTRAEHALAALMILLLGVLIAICAIVVTSTGAALVVAALTNNALWTPHVFDATFVAILVKGILAAWYVSGFSLILAYTAAIVARSAAVGIAFGIGSTLAEIVLRGIFASLGGVWDTISSHFPFAYTESMITRVISPELIPGSRLASIDPSTPGAGASLIALGIYAAALLVVMLVALQRRDVTA